MLKSPKTIVGCEVEWDLYKNNMNDCFGVSIKNNYK